MKAPHRLIAMSLGLIAFLLGLSAGATAAPFAYVANTVAGGSAGAVSVIETATDSVIDTVSLLLPARDVAVHPTGTRVYVTGANLFDPTSNGIVSVIATPGNTVIDTVEVRERAEGVAVHPDGTRAYVTDEDNESVVVIDTTTNIQIFTVPVGGSPEAIAIGPELKVVDLVDPVPDLLEELKQTTEQAKIKLAKKTETVEGVAADGVARVVARVTAPGPGTVELALVDEAGIPVDPPEEAGLLTELGQSEGSNALFVPTVDVPEKGPMAFAIYRVPSQFVRAGSQDANAKDRQVSLRVRFIPQAGGGGQESTTQIKITRPPVVLVHGIWSDSSTWDFFSPLIVNQQFPDPRFTIFRINYKGTNAEGFELNAAITLNDLRKFIELFKSDAQVAAVQADVVAHSMGGMVARSWVINPDPPFSRDVNFEQGDVHKLITINTPHHGSAFANRLLGSSDLCKALFSAANFRVADAVLDLSTGSQIVQRLKQASSTPLPAHVIVGIASQTQESQTQGDYEDFILALALPLGRAACVNVLPEGRFPEVFSPPGDLGPNSDLIVSEGSQEALTLAASGGDPPSDKFLGIVHAVFPLLFKTGPDALSRNLVQSGELVGVPTGIPQKVIDLLNQPVMGGNFSPMLP